MGMDESKAEGYAEAEVKWKAEKEEWKTEMEKLKAETEKLKAERIKMIHNLKLSGLHSEAIAKITGLSLDEIEHFN
jgi:hypothetical protein